MSLRLLWTASRHIKALRLPSSELFCWLSILLHDLSMVSLFSGSAHVHIHLHCLCNSKLLLHCLLECTDGIPERALTTPCVHCKPKYWQSPQCPPTEALTVLRKSPDTLTGRLWIRMSGRSNFHFRECWNVVRCRDEVPRFWS